MSLPKKALNNILGDINEFLEKKQLEDMRLLAKKDVVEKSRSKAQAAKPKTQDKSADDKKGKEKEIKKLKADMEKCEKRIAELEAQMADLDQKLQDPQQFQGMNERSRFFHQIRFAEKTTG